MTATLVGKNSIIEALKAGRSINKILIEKGRKAVGFSELLAIAKMRRIVVQEVDSQALDRAVDGQKHQGLVALVSPTEYADIDDVLQKASISDKPPFLVLLDEIQDPHNLGAIVRSCEAAGVDAIVITQRRCCPVTETVAKSSSGAIEHIPIVRIGNLVQLVERLKKNGYWIAGADMDGDNLWKSEVGFDFPLALIVGGESKGIGRLLKSECDFIFSIPMRGKVNSLNASVATALLVFEVIKRREALA